MGEDYVGAMGDAIAGVGAKVDAERRRIAELRRWSEGTSVNPVREGRTVPPAGDSDLANEAQRAAEQIAQLQIRALEASGAFRMAVQMEYERDLQGFRDMLDQKIISQAQFDQARAALMEMAARDMIDATEREFAHLVDVTDAMSGAMENAFNDFLETGKASFSQFASSVISDIARIALRMMVLQPLFGGGPDGGIGLVGSALASAFGGFRANGGPVSPNKAYIVGERGPELFRPRVAGGIVPNEALGRSAGGGGVSLNLTINAPNSTPDAVRQLEARIPGIVLTAIREANSRKMA
jgi:lambda family phage tail tape measure protein